MSVPFPSRMTLTLALVATTACAGEPPRVVARDSAGVRVVTSRGPTGAAWRVGPATLELGGAGAAEDAILAGVVAAALTRDGRVLVADGSQTVRFFDAAGTLLRTTGGRGGGPGEFEMIAAAGPGPGDSAWVYDYSHRRITRLDESGRVASVVSLDDPPPALLPVGRLADGRLVLASSYVPPSTEGVPRAGLRRDTVPYVLYGADGTRSGLIAHLPGREYVIGEEGGRATMATPPFARAASHATLDSALVHGDRERREVRIWSPSGRLRLIARWAGPPLEVTPEALEAELDRRLARHGQDDAGLRRFLAELPRPITRPAHGPLLAAPDGHVLIAPTTEAEGGRWTVLAPTGEWVAELEVPERFRPTHVAEGRVVGVWRDALDVERVQVRPLVRP